MIKMTDDKYTGSDGKEYGIPHFDESKINSNQDKEPVIPQKNIKVDIDGKTDIKLNDVIGLYEPKMYLIDRLHDYYKNKSEYEKHGLKPSRGMLLYGLPGTGKTFLLKAIINDLIKDKPQFFYVQVQMSELMHPAVGKSSEKIHAFFSGMKETCTKENKDCILIIDEIDVICPARSKTQSVLTQERTSQFLTEINGIEENDHIFIIGATNRPWNIDNAALRSGRIEAMFKIDPPDFNLRKSLAEKYLKNIPLDPKIDFSVVANGTENFVGADFNRLGFLMLKSHLKTKQPISLMDFIESIGTIKTQSHFFLNKKRVEKWAKSHERK